ncbi:MAG: dihydroorotase [Gammaproteobacteria bacterium]|nr:dihydroorotase [Gammaproteobacteria bacterium]
MKPAITQLTLTRPDDWHLHVRDGDAMASVIGHTARQFARAIIMPNLRPPVTTTERAVAYRQRIIAALPEGSDFQPLMTLYLTDSTSPGEISRAKNSGVVYAVKLYPAGATTNADSGVTQLQKTYSALAAMEAHGLPLLVHGEVTDPAIDIFDREKVFIDQQLIPLTKQFPNLKIVFEHITTRDAVNFVLEAGANIAATITPQHLLLNRNAMLVGGIHPHNYCLPVLKRETHREALLAAATSGNAKFFLGTDSAPHAKGAKQSACGCAGIYSAPVALELYATAFEQADALDKLEGFASHFGADFYGLPRNADRITLLRQEQTVADEYRFGCETLVPFFAGQTLAWRLQ